MNRKMCSKKGFVVIIVLFTMILLIATGIALLNLGFKARLMSTRVCSDICAKSAVDAALAKALSHINQDLSQGIFNDYSLPEANDVPLEHCDATFSYDIIKNGSGKYVIRATGYSGPVRKTADAVLEAQGGGASPFDYGIMTKGTLMKGANTTWSGYNMPPGEVMKMGTTSSSSETLLDSTMLDGDFFVGPGGNPGSVTLKSCTVTGDIYALTEDEVYDWPDVVVPTEMQNLSSSGTLDGVQTLTTSAKYDSVQVERDDLILIDGPVTIYCTGNFELSGGGEIQINPDNPNASLTVYANSFIGMGTGGMINNLSEEPVRVKIYGTPTCNQVTLGNAGSLYACVYTPNAELYLKNGLTYYGSIGSKALYADRNSDFHYDGSLLSADIDDIPGSGPPENFTIARWSE